MKHISIIYAFTILMLLLAGCSSENEMIISHKYTVVMPDDRLFNCNSPDILPNSKTLTDADVAKTVVKLYQNNVQCKRSIDSIKKFLEDSKKNIEAEESKDNQRQ